MGHILEAFRLIGRNPRLWRYIVQPLIVAALIFVAVLTIGYFALVPPLAGIAKRMGMDAEASTVMSTVVYALIWFFIAGVVFIGIASFFSSMLWDRLSIEIEELVSGEAVLNAPPNSVIFADSMKRMALTLFMGVVGLCANVVPVIGPIAIAGLVGMLDYTANAYIRRNILLGGQPSRVFRLRGAAGFYITAGIITLIPFVNLLLLPVMVAAGTVMVVRSEMEGKSARALP